MGLLQPDVGHGGRSRESRLSGTAKAITIHSLRHARAAAAAAAESGIPLLLVSAPSAAAYAGPGWFGAIARQIADEFPDAEITAILDCGDRPGQALAALRHGLKTIRYDGTGHAAIADIARQNAASVLQQRPQALDLHDFPQSDDDARLRRACRNWLEEE
jgi:saccharopine dehydrogenase-like NADP-dependent oxidoreductase